MAFGNLRHRSDLLGCWIPSAFGGAVAAQSWQKDLNQLAPCRPASWSCRPARPQGPRRRGSLQVSGSSVALGNAWVARSPARTSHQGHRCGCMVRSPRKAFVSAGMGASSTRGGLLEPASLDYALEAVKTRSSDAPHLPRHRQTTSIYTIDWAQAPILHQRLRAAA